jgi:hypothetical protein
MELVAIPAKPSAAVGTVPAGIPVMLTVAGCGA